MFLENLLLEYFDQNEPFGSFMPRKVKPVKIFKSTDSGKEWLLVKLEDPFTFGQPNEFGNHMLNNTHSLITTRYQGDKVSNTKFHAHVVLVPELPDMNQELIIINKSNHVAWCVARKCT